MINVTYIPNIYRASETVHKTSGQKVPAMFDTMPLSAVIKGIQNGLYNKHVSPARMEYLENGKSEEYKKLKAAIPAVAFAGTFSKEVKNDCFLNASGIFNLDFDKLGVEGAKECKEALKANKHVIFAFISPSGDGVKAGVRIGTVLNDFQYKQYFEPINGLINPYVNDPSVKDVRRLCFMSYDPDCYYNENAEPFIIELTEKQDKPAVEFVKPVNNADDDVLKALDYLSPNEYHDWIKYGQALKSGGYSFDVFASWSSSYEGFDHEQALKKWESFKPSSIAPATIVYDAMQKGFSPSFVAPEIDYDLLPDTEVFDFSERSTEVQKESEDDNYDWKIINERIREINKDYCFVTDGGKSFVIRQSIDEDGIEQLEYLQKNAFLDCFANEFYITGEDSKGSMKKAAIGDLWFKSDKRLQYIRGTTFQPAKEGVPVIRETLNLWRGFQYQPIKTECETALENVRLYHDLMKNVICNGVEEHYVYLLKWIAWGFQYPQKQAGSAIVIYGEKGIGKGTIGKLCLKLWGIYGKQILQAKHLTGNFNAHLARCCFVLADEAFFSGDKSQDGVLKGLITEDFIMVERKNVDAKPMRNRLKVMMLSNNEQVVVSGRDERRYFVLEVGSHKKGDYDYWKRINAAIEDETALSAFMYELQNIDLSDFVIQVYPETNGNKKQRFKSLCPAGQYFADCLTRGYLYQSDNSIGHDTWEGDISPRISTALIHAGFIQWCKDHSKSGWDRMTQKEMGDYLDKIFQNKDARKNSVIIKDGEKTTSSNPITCLIISTLSEAVTKFCDYEKLNPLDILKDGAGSLDDSEDMDFSDYLR